MPLLVSNSDCDLIMFIHWDLAIVITFLTLDHQVLGGHEVVPHSRPYMVFIERSMKNGENDYCNGFLLSEDFVMTAANCKAKSYKVFLGAQNLNTYSVQIQNITVEQAFPHKNYKQHGLKNDVMLLKLSSKAKFNINVGPIAISGQGEGCQPKSCIVTGWVVVDRNSTYTSYKLMEINITMTNDKQCMRNNLYCLRSKDFPGPKVIGSPLVCEHGYAYGVVSSFGQSGPGGRIYYTSTIIPDSRHLADWFMEHHNVCGRAPNLKRKKYWEKNKGES